MLLTFLVAIAGASDDVGSSCSSCIGVQFFCEMQSTRTNREAARGEKLTATAEPGLGICEA
jgi:hypothetical protein